MAGLLRVRAVPAEPGDGAPDDVAVLGLHGVVAQPEPVELSRPVRLHDHVRPRHEPAEDRGRAVAAQVESDGTLPTVERHVRRVEPAPTDAPQAVTSPRRLHLHHLSAEVGEEKRAERPRRNLERSSTFTSWSGPGGASPPRCRSPVAERRQVRPERRGVLQQPGLLAGFRPRRAGRRRTCAGRRRSAPSRRSLPPTTSGGGGGRRLRHAPPAAGPRRHRGALESEWPPAWPRGSVPAAPPTSQLGVQAGIARPRRPPRPSGRSGSWRRRRSSPPPRCVRSGPPHRSRRWQHQRHRRTRRRARSGVRSCRRTGCRSCGRHVGLLGQPAHRQLLQAVRFDQGSCCVEDASAAPSPDP